MNVSLPADLKQWIDREVASGRFASAEEAIAVSVRLLAEQQTLREKVEQGLRSLEEGRAIPGDVVFARLRERIEQMKSERGAAGA